MAWAPIVAKLLAGLPVTFSPTGNSMSPRIKSGQAVTVLPMGAREPEVGMVVLAKVSGRYYLHLVSLVRGRRVQISNNHGFINGWTTTDRVYGYVDEGGGAAVGAKHKTPPKAPARDPAPLRPPATLGRRTRVASPSHDDRDLLRQSPHGCWDAHSGRGVGPG